MTARPSSSEHPASKTDVFTSNVDAKDGAYFAFSFDQKLIFVHPNLKVEEPSPTILQGTVTLYLREPRRIDSMTAEITLWAVAFGRKSMILIYWPTVRSEP